MQAPPLHKPGEEEDLEIISPDIPGGSLHVSRNSTWAFEDKSTPVPHHRKGDLLPDLHMALGIWAQLGGISDKNYRSLKEILQTHIKPESMEYDLSTLPASVGTLKKKR